MFSNQNKSCGQTCNFITIAQWNLKSKYITLKILKLFGAIVKFVYAQEEILLCIEIEETSK